MRLASGKSCRRTREAAPSAPTQDISFGAGPVLEAGNDLAVLSFLEGLKGFAVGDRVFKTLGEDLAQCDAADGPRRVWIGLLRVWDFYKEQSRSW